jgi:hypothetical protein
MNTQIENKVVAVLTGQELKTLVVLNREFRAMVFRRMSGGYLDLGLLELATASDKMTHGLVDQLVDEESLLNKLKWRVMYNEMIDQAPDDDDEYRRQLEFPFNATGE